MDELKFPKVLKVGVVDYDIAMDDNLQRMHENSHEYADIDYEIRRISLSTKYCDEQKRDSLVHEVVHAICDHMCINWGDKNENYVERIANGLAMVFKDNPEFVKLLSE